MRAALATIAAFLALLPCVSSAAPPAPTERGDRLLAEFFKSETKKLEEACLADVKSPDDWNSRRGEYRRQLLEMLGLDPFPEKTDLKAAVTGTFDPPRQTFTVEKLHFQSRPGLYVTGNLYVPKGLTKPAPAILYVCGHGGVKKDGVIYGNKVTYQHHAIWFARHGYVCLVLDTLQLGEIEGVHHGTYDRGMWWWNSRGYTPAGVEAWNCVRAVDYLQSRSDVADPQRIGVTGRSGGGAYSWWIGAVDDRIKAAVPVAGITDLHNHVVDGVVEGHCDCMYMVNTYRWDYPQVAALLAPRPLMIGNTDKDTIFPLDGVMRTYWKVRRLYELHGAPEMLGPTIGEGPHKDTAELQVGAFRWFNRHLTGQDPPIDEPAVKLFEPELLKVFKELPADSINARVHETFVPAAAPPTVPGSAEAWAKQRDAWMTGLREKCFGAWPSDERVPPLDVTEAYSAEREDLVLKAYDFTSQEAVRLRLFVMHPPGLKAKPEGITAVVADDESWAGWLASVRPLFADELKDEPAAATAGPGAGDLAELTQRFERKDWAVAFIAPRGVGPTAFKPTPFKQTQVRRRFMLLGQTLESAQVWDVRRALQALRNLPGGLSGIEPERVGIYGSRQMSVVALYASLFEPAGSFIELNDPPATHADGPHFLNVLRVLDTPAAVAMAAERTPVRIVQQDAGRWTFPKAVAAELRWPLDRVTVTSPVPPPIE